MSQQADNCFVDGAMRCKVGDFDTGRLIVTASPEGPHTHTMGVSRSSHGSSSAPIPIPRSPTRAPTSTTASSNGTGGAGEAGAAGRILCFHRRILIGFSNRTRDEQHQPMLHRLCLRRASVRMTRPPQPVRARPHLHTRYPRRLTPLHGPR